jgi:peptidoglycan pentaglycine glycine transferase (the first glycine)
MDGQTWNELIRGLPGAHIWQTWQWGEIKQQTGWTPVPRVWRSPSGQVQAAALVLERTIRPAKFGAALRVLYVPRGPVMDWSDVALRGQVLADLQTLARQHGAIFIKIDPEVILGRGIPSAEDDCVEPIGAKVQADLQQHGWIYSQDQIQFRNTVWLDLSGSEEDWLARMKQKTRYNLRLAQKKGVSVREVGEESFSDLYRMYAETSVRDGFVIRPQEYYARVWRTYRQAGMAVCLMAEAEGQPVAGLILMHFAGKAWYLYGMSTQAHRERMPNYLLQWEAMRIAKMNNCLQYDLWGAPDIFDESDSMWGVFRFKEGLGGRVVRTLGAWDYTPNRLFYQIYTRLVPRLLDVLRRRGKARTRQEVSL